MGTVRWSVRSLLCVRCSRCDSGTCKSDCLPVQTSAVRRMLVKPEVVDGELGPGSRVWCYCCEVEVPKHVSDQECCIVWGGMMEHMRRCGRGCDPSQCGSILLHNHTHLNGLFIPLHSPAHLKCVRHFCWYNGVDQSVGERMVVGDQEFQNYKLTVSKLLNELMSKKEVARRQVRVWVHCGEGLLL